MCSGWIEHDLIAILSHFEIKACGEFGLDESLLSGLISGKGTASSRLFTALCAVIHARFFTLSSPIAHTFHLSGR